MSELTEAEHFDLVADRIEAKLHGDVRILVDKNWDGTWHVEVQEIAEEGAEDEDGWEDITSDGYFTINEKRDCSSLAMAALWLEGQYL